MDPKSVLPGQKRKPMGLSKAQTRIPRREIITVNAIAITKNEYVSKWGKYQLTLPVKRTDIVKSLFLNQMIWLLVGTFFVGIEICLS